MKKQLPKRAAFLLNFFIVMAAFQMKAQNINPDDGVNWVGSINGYSQPTNNNASDYRVLKYRKVSTTAANPSDGRGQWATTVNVQNSGGNVQPANMPGGSGSGFLFTSGGGAGQGNFGNKWAFGGVGQAALNAVNGTNHNGSTDMGLNMINPGRYTFVFKDAGYAATGFYVGFTTDEPVTMAHDAGTQQSVSNAIATISATLSGTPSPQENFYVRYRTATNDFSTTANVVQAAVSGTTITATIPAQAAATVYYYIFSSTRTLSQITGGSAADISYEALRYADNAGANYSYVVVAAPGQPGAMSGSGIVCANSSQTYSVANDPAATSYTWALPPGWTGTGTTNSITVTTGTNGGTLSVTATNNSGTSPARDLAVAINSGTSITAGPSASAQTVCAGTAVTPLSVSAEGSALTYQWYKNASNSNSGGTLIGGATSAAYDPGATIGAFYYYCVVSGACTPTTAASSVSGLVTVNGLPNDNAGNSAYSNGWAASNGGAGFGPWSFTTSGTAGIFKGSSDIGASSWGAYANGGGAVRAVRPFAVPLNVGSNVSFAMDNGFIDNGSSVGMRLSNASGNTLMEFRFVGGGSQYTTVDGSGTGNTTVTYTGSGLSNITIAYTAANTYSISITKSGTTSFLTGRLFSAAAGGQVPAQIEFFNNNAGSGSNYDAFFNNLAVGYPKIFVQPSVTAQPSVCQNSAATVLSVTAYGNNAGYQWYSNAANSNSGGTPIPNATSNAFSPPTATAGTAYYYCEVSDTGAGSCVTAIKSAVSGAVTVIAATTYYADADGDGFGDPSNTAQACSVPVGYAENALDCDDTQIFYEDEDGDGFGNFDVYSACNGITNLDDCDDTVIYYTDADGDGFGSDVFSACSGVTNNTDCNDASAEIYQSASLFIDGDGDGYNAGTAPVCYGASAPAGYSLTTSGIDCDDLRASVHPGATEIGYNLIDDDCDGSIDEGFAPITTVPQQCNSTLSAIDSYVYANLVAGAQGYRWRVTTMSGPNTGQVQMIDTPLRTMRITQLTSYAFSTAYKIEVAVYYAGYLQPFTATSCTVSTPATATQLVTCTGNATILTMSDAVYAVNVPFAAGYRFRVSDPNNPSASQELFRATREFRMSQITAFQVQYNKVYNVQVSVKNTDGSYIPYTSTCNVTTPMFPTTSLQDSQCDDYAVAGNATALYAVSYPGAIGYAFQMKGPGLPVNGVVVTKQLRSFTLSDFPALQPGQIYNVRVRLIFNSTDPEGSYGKTCSIVAPAGAKGEPSKMKGLFSAVAYPNPFGESLSIGVTTASDSNVGIRVYDMMGRLLENSTQAVSGMGSFRIGNGYPAGVYNVIVSQGDETRTLRVVKR